MTVAYNAPGANVASESSSESGSGHNAPNNPYNPYNTNFKPLFCTGDALAAKGVSIGLDVVGAIPGLGNTVSAGAGIARAGREAFAHTVDGIVAFGGGGYSAATGAFDEDPVGGLSAGGGIGLALAAATLGGTKAIPIVGNVVSGLTGLYDIYGAYKAYQKCMTSSKYD